MRYLLTLILTLLAVPVMAFDACMTGSWYDPQRDGEGINIEVLDDTVIAYFYRPGASNQRWYLMIGDRPEGGDARLGVYQSVGVDEVYWIGDALISVTGDNTLDFSYEFRYDMTRGGDDLPWCIGCNGAFMYVRLTQPIPCD